MKRVQLADKTFREFISAQQIAEAVDRVAAEINADHAKGVFQDTPLVLSILNGSVVFCCDLMRKLDFGIELSFVKLSSYVGTQSSGCVKSLIGLNESIEGRDVIVVEDIVETGGSIAAVECDLLERGAASIRVCTLTYKSNLYRGSRAINYVGFEIGDEFIVGYGLDYDRLGRELADIYVVEDE